MTASAGARPTTSTSETESPLMNAVPLLAVGILGAALCLGAALTPARAVPWESASRALHDRRQELALLGALGLVATALFFLFALVSA